MLQIYHIFHNANTSTCDFDEMKIEKVAINPADIVNKNLPADNHCANISQDFIALIPPPKEKKSRVAKPKTEKPPKEAKRKAKPRGKSS